MTGEMGWGRKGTCGGFGMGNAKSTATISTIDFLSWVKEGAVSSCLPRSRWVELDGPGKGIGGELEEGVG